MLDQNGNFVQIKSYSNEVDVEAIVNLPTGSAYQLTPEQSFRVECIRWDMVGAGELMAHYCPESDELKAALKLLADSFQMAVRAITHYERNSEKDH